MSFYDILLAKKLGGGGGSSVSVEPLSVTQNGTYSETGKAYSPVNVNVPNSYTASDEGKVVSNGALVAQTSQTIDSNGTYDTTLKNSVTVNVSGGGGPVIMGVLRPDAELAYKLEYDALVVEDLEYSIPAYSTSNKTVVSNTEVGDRVYFDFDNYDYVVVERGLAIPIYDTDTAMAGREEYAILVAVSQIIHTNAGLYAAISDPTKGYNSVSNLQTNLNNKALVYWASGSAVSEFDSPTVGIYLNYNAPSANYTSGYIVAKSPTLILCGNPTYLSQAAWEHLTDIRYQYVIEFYRIPKSDTGVNGWANYSLLEHTLECALSSTHKLT